MNGHGVRNVKTMVLPPVQAVHQVEVLEMQTETLIETAHLLERLGSKQHTRAGNRFRPASPLRQLPAMGLDAPENG